jgi:DNA processing protein
MSILFSQNLLKNNEILPQEAEFTEVLNSIAVKPKILYLYGYLPENRLKLGCKKLKIRPKSIAIVGSRKPTKYGENIAYRLAYEAARRGAVVVSGLAYGIDSVAHRAALDAGGVTVAVLGTPIDQIYPRPHRPLAAEIVEKGGCVLSELPPGASFYPKTSFLKRNRIISGLADVVVIPEAAERSGSLNTAAHALEQGREVFAVPGDITRPLSRGCNRLIRQGATPMLEIDDVLEVLFPTPRRKITQTTLPIGDSPVETKILQLLASGVQDGEQIMQGIKIELAKSSADKSAGETAVSVDNGIKQQEVNSLTVAEFNQAITLLEIKNRVVALGANQWMLR